MICRKEWLEKTGVNADGFNRKFITLAKKKEVRKGYDFFPNVISPPQHPNCKCIVPNIEVPKDNNIVIDICKAYKEWEKGCSNASLDKPEECEECTEAFFKTVKNKIKW